MHLCAYSVLCLLINLQLHVQFLLFKALNQNAELRSRLNRIHSESIICDQVVSVNIIPSPDEVRLIFNRCRVLIL